MRLSMVTSLVFAVAVLGWGPAAAQSGWERPDNPQLRVGLWVGETDREARVLGDELRQWVDDRGGVLVRMGAVEVAEASDRARAVATISENGREKFFFEGPGVALEWLEDRLRRRLAVTRPWWDRPEAGEALFRAGIMVVRAHSELGDRERARRWMRRLVAALPAHRPDAREVPPDIVEMWETIHAEFAFALDEAYLDVSRLCRDRGGDCQVRVNGAAVDGDVVDVAADRGYLVTEERSPDRRRSWWVRADPGETRKVDPPDGSTEFEQLGSMMERRARRADLDIVVYVGPADCDGAGESGCVAVYGAGEGREGERVRPFEPGLVERLLNSLGEP